MIKNPSMSILFFIINMFDNNLRISLIKTIIKEAFDMKIKTKKKEKF